MKQVAHQGLPSQTTIHIDCFEALGHANDTVSEFRLIPHGLFLGTKSK
jgi:hypothetical protein